MVQWLRLRAPKAGCPSPIPGQGTRSHMLQLRVQMPKLQDPAKTYAGMFKAAIFITIRNWKQLWCPSTMNEQTKCNVSMQWNAI